VGLGHDGDTTARSNLPQEMLRSRLEGWRARGAGDGPIDLLYGME